MQSYNTFVKKLESTLDTVLNDFMDEVKKAEVE